MAAIGIDFGTTNSVLAHYADGTVEVDPIDTPRDDEWAQMGFDRLLPSVFAHGDAGEPLFGWEAKLRTGRKLEAVKRLLSAEDQVTFDGREYLVEELAALLFGAIKQGAAERAGLDVHKAVVTVPANSRGLARLRTRICAGLAGIEVPVLINEPTAAAMAYGLRRSEERTVLVVDWGGGTLDVTLLMVADDVFVEQASKGVGRLGGVDIDKLMFQHLSEDLPSATEWTPEEVAATMIEIEKAKIRLSTQEETSVAFPRGQRKLVTRRRFNEWIEPLLSRLLEPVRTVVAEGEASGSAVDSVLLVGGSCKIPAVADMIAELTGREPLQGVVDPMTAVAEGAAIAAAILDGERDADFFVTTEHALGTSVLNPKTGTSEFSIIIPRNMKIPARARESFFPMVEDQESVRLEVFEGDAVKPLTDPENVKLAEFEVSLVPRPLAEARVEIEYSYDANGILQVTAIDGIDDQVLFQGDVQSMVGRNPGELAAAAQRVESTLSAHGNAPTTGPPGATLPPEVQDSLDRARVKVIPFVPDDEAEVLRSLADDLERAAQDGAWSEAETALEVALRRYAYLF